MRAAVTNVALDSVSHLKVLHALQDIQAAVRAMRRPRLANGPPLTIADTAEALTIVMPERNSRDGFVQQLG